MIREKTIRSANGWVMFLINLGIIFAGIWLVIDLVQDIPKNEITWSMFLSRTFLILLGIFSLGGQFTLQPNEARVLMLAGKYMGTVRKSGFHWTIPLFTKNKISLRSRNLNGQILKVNDKRGNPIEIAAVIVWRVEDTAEAMFEVENYSSYVTIQSESAVRQGAVGMVQQALTELFEKNIVQLDEERKAAMVSNLLVVLCGEAEVHPVVNAGTLYT
ncbi:hypothetical protein L0244_08245 [bacterium]|nr:hypothetical protein [bacterium]MCI0612966.1 hypothetical protein [bacterium]